MRINGVPRKLLKFFKPKQPQGRQQLQGLKADFVSVWTCWDALGNHERVDLAVPLLGYAEKQGTFTNANGIIRALSDPFPAAAPDAVDVQTFVATVEAAWDKK